MSDPPAKAASFFRQKGEGRDNLQVWTNYHQVTVSAT